MEDHSEGILVNQFYPKNIILKLGGGGRDMTFLDVFYYVKNWKVLAYQYQKIVLESFPGSDSTNAVIKLMPIPVASPGDKDYYRN